MDRKSFFTAVRGSIFKGSLSEPQVQGMEAILDAADRHGVSDIQHLANILAEVHHETGGYMLGIKETVFPSHADKNPPDSVVKARLETAWAKGQLPWVKTPYWRDGWFGRGPIQLTHKSNYETFEKRLKVPLTAKPELALDPTTGADIAVVGMLEGLFTGKKLSDYRFPDALRAVQTAKNPRRIINGADGTDAKVALVHVRFVEALKLAGWRWQPDAVLNPVELPDVPDQVPHPHLEVPATGDASATSGGWVQAIVDLLLTIFMRGTK